MRTRKQILRDSLPLKDAIVTAPQVYLELILEVLLDIREHATLEAWKQSATVLLEKYQALAESLPATIGEDRVDVIARALKVIRR